jgi:predicted RNase H-like nuclease (RuvC/YqgF family)
MVQRHKEKIKALRALEDEKKVEIKALQKQMEAVRAAAAESAKLAAKIQSYREFIARYVVEAQEEKARAVREAEAFIQHKYGRAWLVGRDLSR